MKLSLHYRLILPAVFLGLAMWTASAAFDRARAFTLEDRADTAPTGGAANIADPDERMTPRSNSGTQSTLQQGNATFNFGGQSQSFDQRNNPNDYFSADKLTGR